MSALAILTGLFIKVKKAKKKQRENISYDLIMIDESDRFFYQNISFEMSD